MIQVRTLSYEGPPDYVGSFIKQNTYSLVTEKDRIMYYTILFRIKQRQDMDDSFLTKIGFTPNYDHKTFYYIESEIQNVPIISNRSEFGVDNSYDNFSNFAVLTVHPQICTVEIERQQKNRTIVDILGSISAIYSLLLFIYLFLFKKEIAEPFGVIYKLHEFKTNLRRTDKIDSEANRNNVWERANRR